MGDKKLEIFDIVPMSQKHKCDINKPNQPFLAFGKLIPSFIISNNSSPSSLGWR
jgi:hypothetical protein